MGSETKCAGMSHGKNGFKIASNYESSWHDNKRDGNINCVSEVCCDKGEGSERHEHNNLKYYLTGLDSVLPVEEPLYTETTTY